MKRFILLVAITLFAGCATIEPTQQHDLAELSSICNPGAPKGFIEEDLEGCVTWSMFRCTPHVLKREAVLAYESPAYFEGNKEHEVRHCTDGTFHTNPSARLPQWVGFSPRPTRFR